MKYLKIIIITFCIFCSELTGAQSNLQILDSEFLNLDSFRFDLRDTLNPRERLKLNRNPRFWSWISKYEYGKYWIMYQSDKTLILETDGWSGDERYTKDSLCLKDDFANSLSWLVHSSILSSRRYSNLDYTLSYSGEDFRRFHLFIDDNATAMTKRYGPYVNIEFDITAESVPVLNLLLRVREAMLGGNISDSLLNAWERETTAFSKIIKKKVDFTPYISRTSGGGLHCLETFNLSLIEEKNDSGKNHIDSLFRETSLRLFLALDSYSTHEIHMKAPKSYVVVDSAIVQFEGDMTYIFVGDTSVTDKRVIVHTGLSDFDPYRMAEAIRSYYYKPNGIYDFDDNTIKPLDRGKAGLPLFDPYSIPKEPVFDIVTTLGTIRVKLSSNTPLHRDNFARLAAGRFFDGTIFHRVIKNFMIQGGDPNTKTTADISTYGEGDAGYWIPAEISPQLTHKKGALAAAREGDDVNPEHKSSSSQFYIVHNPDRCKHLDGKYTVFGQTISGFEVLDAIANVPCGAIKKDMPNYPVTIIAVNLVK